MNLDGFRRMIVRAPRAIGFLAVLLLLFAASLVRGIGCSRQEEPRFVPIIGRITLDGRPLVAAVVCFRSEDREFRAVTDADGRYQVNPGAVPGEYRVSVTTFADRSQAILAMDPAAAPPFAGQETPRPNTQNVPDRYRDPEKTKLRLVVSPEGIDRADFSLTSN